MAKQKFYIGQYEQVCDNSASHVTRKQINTYILFKYIK